MKQIYLIFLILLYSCVDTPNEPTYSNVDINSGNSAIILCEGLKGHDNSSISYYDHSSGIIQNYFYQDINPGFKIGDTANDMVNIGDTVLIAVTGSKTIEMFESTTGHQLGRVVFQGNKSPRHIAVVNDSVVAVTHLYSNQISFVNIRNKKVLQDVSVGPNPEGIAYKEPYIYVCNSGLGALNKTAEKAGTLSVIDKYGNYITDIYCGPNVQDVIISSTLNRAYVSYNNTYLPDSLGGIVEINLNNLEISNKWQLFAFEPYLDDQNNRLYFIEQTPPGLEENNWRGVSYLDINTGQINRLIENTSNSEFWYSVNVNNKRGEIWIANAKNYVIEGEVIIYDAENLQEISSLKVGLNPNTIVF